MQLPADRRKPIEERTKPSDWLQPLPKKLTYKEALALLAYPFEDEPKPTEDK